MLPAFRGQVGQDQCQVTVVMRRLANWMSSRGFLAMWRAAPDDRGESTTCRLGLQFDSLSIGSTGC